MINPLINLYLAHKYKHLNVKEFKNRYQKEISQISIGCSFNPEHWIFYKDADSPYAINNDKHQGEIVLKVAKFIVEDLKIKNIRLSIRWSEVYKNGEIDLTYYKDLFNYILSQDVKITLNVGPIKTMRWPEETVPEDILLQLKSRPDKEVFITAESELGQISLSYVHALLQKLKSEFTNEQLEKIETFQTNNEAFNKFGHFGWTMSDEFEMKVVEIVNQEFPNKRFLFNSAGRNDLNRVTKLVFKLANKLNKPFTDFVIGYNYYFKVPQTAKNFILKYFDNLWIAIPGSMSTSKLKKLCKDKGFTIEVSELQGEPWLGIDAPGNSLSDFLYSLIRCFQSILNLNDQKRSIIRYWGIEDLVVKKLKGENSKEHEKIFDLIKEINNYGSTEK